MPAIGNESKPERSAKINGVAFKAIIVSVAAACFLLILGATARSKKPLRTALHTSLQGIAALTAVNLTGLITGVTLSLNAITVLFTLIAGLPGVVMLTFLKLIWKI